MRRAKDWSKYGAKKTRIDGVVFHSKREASRYQQLKYLQLAGEISELKLQPRYELWAGDQPIRIMSERYHKTGMPLVYVADFEYVEGGQVVTEDVKGHTTQVAKIKMALFELQSGRKIRIVR